MIWAVVGWAIAMIMGLLLMFYGWNLLRLYMAFTGRPGVLSIVTLVLGAAVLYLSMAHAPFSVSFKPL